MTATPPDPPDLDPTSLAGTGFSRARRGFEPVQVNSALGRAADALRAWEVRDAALLERIADLEARLSESAELDEERITKVLGEETARIVTAARDAAAEIRAKAESDSARLVEEAAAEADRLRTSATEAAEAMRGEASRALEEARSDADRLRTAAETAAAALDEAAQVRHDELTSAAEQVLAERTSAAEAEAAGIREAAEAELSTARAEGERIRSDATAAATEALEQRREEGRAMVAEAKEVRERMLRDLAERRRTARRQIEGARGGRERVVELLRAAIAEATATVDRLEDSDAAVQAAADTAALGVEENLDRVVADLEAELTVVAELDEAEPARSVPTAAEAEPSEPEAESAESEAESDAAAVVTEIVEVVETVEAELVVAESLPADDADSPDADAVAEPAEDSAAEDSGAKDGAVEDSAVEDGAAGDAEETDDEAPGATVHDLFARLRAEGLDDASVDDDPARNAEDTAAIDLTDDDAAADGEAAVSPSAVALATAEPIEADADTSSEVREAEAVLDRRDDLLLPIEKGFARILKRLVSDEQNEVLDRLRRVKRGRADPEEILPDVASSVETYTEALLGEFTESVDAGSSFWSELAGSSSVSLFEDDTDLSAVLRESLSEFLSLHRAHLARTFEDADEAGLDVADLSARVRSAYRDWRSMSLPGLAGDLMTAGFAFGERRAAGPDAQWCWMVDNGGLPCADGDDNALAGAVRCGEEFPTGDVTPPAHPGCRCVLVPVHQ